MEDKDKTHYRKAFNSPYLSSGDIVEPTTLTIQRVELEIDKTKKTKDMFNTAYFVEREIRHGEALKPMILNATNSRTMKTLTGSPYINDWGGTVVTVYVEQGVRFGRDTVEGLRISTEKPRTAKPELVQGTPAWGRAVKSLQQYGNLDKVRQFMTVSVDSEILLTEDAGMVTAIENATGETDEVV